MGAAAPQDLSGPPGFKAATEVVPAAIPPAEDPSSTAGLLDESALVPHDGDLVVSEDGAVVENLDLTGTIRVKAKDVTIRNVRVTAPPDTQVGDLDQLVLQQGRGTGLRLEHVEIDGRGVVEIGVIDSNGKGMVVIASDIHGVGNGIQFSSNTLIEGNWIHDIVMKDEWHPDGIQTDGAVDFTIRNNRVSVARNATSAIGVWAELGNTGRGLVTGNVAGGGGYVFYVQAKGKRSMQAMVYTDNVISTDVAPDGGGYGVWYPQGQPETLVRTGNRFDDGRPANTNAEGNPEG